MWVKSLSSNSTPFNCSSSLWLRSVRPPECWCHFFSASSRVKTPQQAAGSGDTWEPVHWEESRTLGGGHTLDLHLVGCAGQTGQDGELLRLVHGVVSAGNHQLIAGLPAAWLVGQFQDTAVGQHVNGNVGLWTNLSDRKRKLGWHLMWRLSSNKLAYMYNHKGFN